MLLSLSYFYSLDGLNTCISLVLLPDYIWCLHHFKVLICCCSVSKLYPILCNPMRCSSQTSLSFTISWSPLKLMSIESVLKEIWIGSGVKMDKHCVYEPSGMRSFQKRGRQDRERTCSTDVEGIVYTLTERSLVFLLKIKIAVIFWDRKKWKQISRLFKT